MNKYSASFGSIPISSKYLVQRSQQVLELHDYTALLGCQNEHLSLALGHFGLLDVLKKLLFCENLKKAGKTRKVTLCKKLRGKAWMLWWSPVASNSLPVDEEDSWMRMRKIRMRSKCKGGPKRAPTLKMGGTAASFRWWVLRFVSFQNIQYRLHWSPLLSKAPRHYHYLPQERPALESIKKELMLLLLQM